MMLWQNDFIMPHADGVKSKFEDLHLAIVPDGRPSHGASYETMFR